MWLETIEDETQEQVRNLANLPFAYRHIAIMPDAHEGFGMCAAKTSLPDIECKKLKRIMQCIRRAIPVGFKHHESVQDEAWMPWGFKLDQLPICSKEYNSALKQLGTLGGNHFIEIQKGDDGFVWIIVHSGSRNIGSEVADHYDKEARRLNELWFSKIDTSKQLAFLPLQTEIRE